ncbi:hypothetical protein [Burkholderia sp. 3C]
MKEITVEFVKSISDKEFDELCHVLIAPDPERDGNMRGTDSD